MNYNDKLNMDGNKKKARLPESLKMEQSTDVVSTLQLKITSLEQTLAEQSSSHNKENKKLREDITKLSASFEKNEVLRRKLEYELTLSNQKTNQVFRKSAENEEELRVEIKTLKEKLATANVALRTSETQLQQRLADFKNESTHWIEAAQIKDATIMELQNENKALYDQRLAADKYNANVKIEASNFEEKYISTKNDLTTKITTINQLEKAIAVKEKDLIVLKQEVSSLKEEVKKQKSENLESKLTINILQEQVNECDNKFTQRTKDQKDIQKNFDGITAKYNELEKVQKYEHNMLSQLQTDHLKLKNDYQRCQDLLNEVRKEFSSDQIRMASQLSAKTQATAKVNAEKSKYQQNVMVLEEKLTLTKTNLSQSELKYSETMKDLKFLLNNYPHVATLPIAEKEERSAVSQLRCMLQDNQKTVDSLKGEIHQNEAMIERLSIECHAHKEVLVNKDKALEETQKLLLSAQTKSSQTQDICRQFEETIQKYSDEVINNKKNLKENEESIVNLKQKIARSEKEKDMLQRDIVSFFKSLLTSENRGNDIGSLKNEILQQVNEEKAIAKENTVKIRDYESSLMEQSKELSKHKTALKQLQQLNGKVMTQTEKSLTVTKEMWQKEKTDLSTNFNQQFVDMKKKYDVDKQNYCIEMKETMIALGDAHTKEKTLLLEEHQREVNHLKKIIQDKGTNYSRMSKKLEKQLKNLKQDKDSISNVLALVTNVLMAVLHRDNQLLEQLWFCKKRLVSLEQLQIKVRSLSDMLSSEMEADRKKVISGVLKFRVAVLSIIAVNRFLKSHSGNYVAFTFEGSSLFVKIDFEKDAVGNVLNWPLQQQCEDAAIRISPELSHPNTQFSEFSQCITKCFTSFYDFVRPNECYYKRVHSIYETKLHEILGKDKGRLTYFTSSNIVSCLRHTILQFTERLHKAETDRKALILHDEQYNDLNKKLKEKLLNERSHYSTLQVQDQLLRDQVFSLETQLQSMVDEKQFEDVCKELSGALRREEDLGCLFQEQAKQIEEMSNRIERHSDFHGNKESELNNVMKDYLACQMELNYVRDHLLVSQDKVNKVREEKKRNLHNSLKEKEKMENLLRERDTIVKYLNVVSASINEQHCEIDIDSIFSQEGVNEMSAELKLCKKTIAQFVKAFNKSARHVDKLKEEKTVLRGKMSQLEADVDAHRKHVYSLKKQISAVCQQEVHACDMTSLVFGNEEFIPLKSSQFGDL